MAKVPAPASLTGGGGYKFEDEVAARFFVDMLAGIRLFGVEFGKLTRIDWQVRDAGWLLDDLLLTYNADTERRSVALSIKSDRQVTRTGFPDDFRTAVWEQWRGEQSNYFQADRDLLGLVTGKLANNVGEAWDILSRELSATSSARATHRYSAEDGHHPTVSDLQKTLFQSLSCPEQLVSPSANTVDEHAQLVARVRLLNFDFGSEPSRDRANCIADSVPRSSYIT